MKSRYAISFLISILIYGVIGVLILNTAIETKATAADKGKTVIQIKQYTTTTPPPPQKQLKEQQTKKPPQQTKKTPQQTKKTPQKPIEKKVQKVVETPQEKVVQAPKEVEQEPIEQELEIEQAIDFDEEFVDLLHKNMNSMQHPKTQIQAQHNANKDIFLYRLREEIEKHKTYPKIAARRGIEGSVKIKFTIDKTGAMKDLILDSTHKIFKKAVAEILDKVFPIEFDFVDVILPMNVELMLEYKLKS